MSRSARDSIPSSYRTAFVFLVGVVLLLNPILVGVTDFGDPDRYRYEASTVAGANGTLDVPPDVNVVEPSILCLNHPVRRACMLERAVLERGGVVYDGLTSHVLSADYAYVFAVVDGEDRFYRPTTSETASGEVRYTHERVPIGEVLHRVSTPLERAAPGIRTTIETGSYTASDPLPTAETLIEADDGYYVVHATATIERMGERRVFVRLLQWLGGAVGVLLIYRTGVRRGRNR